jgi:hypothetical protein
MYIWIANIDFSLWDFCKYVSCASLERNAWNKLNMLSGVPMSTITVAADKFNTALELNVQGVLRIVIHLLSWTLFLLLYSVCTLCRVSTLIFLRQTMSLGNTVLQLFWCNYSWCVYCQYLFIIIIIITIIIVLNVRKDRT